MFYHVNAHCTRSAQRLADDDGGVEKHLTGHGFTAWAKRLPAAAATMRSLLAISSATSNGTSCLGAGAAAGSSAAGSSGGAASAAGADSASCSGSKGGSSKANAASSSHLQLQLPAVPQLLSLQGVSAASLLMRQEWAWAIAASGFLPPQR